VSFSSFEITQKCRRCAREIPPGALECPECRTLVHGDEMEQLAAHARSLEAHGELMEARERWRACLPLLPPQSAQSEWIRGHIRELETGPGAAQNAPSGPAASTAPNWATRLGPLGAIALSLWKFKSLLSFALFFGLYWQLWGWKFGLGFAVLILIHEMGHFIDIKRRGLPVDMPMFVPGLGAYVRWNALGVSLKTRAAVALAGPLAGWFAAAICTVIGYQTGYGLWAALARTGAWFNALNLIPLWIFDGSRATDALNRLERAVVLMVAVTLGVALHDWVFYLVAGGAGIRLFSRDVPDEPSGSMAAYFVAVMTGLALILWLVPGHGAGLR
jgi:Zn-dependent protease